MPSPQLNEDAGETSSNGRTSRLMITKIVLENFKSYAGVQEVGPFHKSFSAVVGPNGSGKSNVIDAMLFVFGRRAKDLRQNKVGELIHHSEKHQDLQHARVYVYFQDIIDLDNDEVEVVSKAPLVISRAAYKNNSSKYFIGDRTSTYSEVTELLKAKGIDLDNNRFLILQGEVEQIAMMKPKAQTQHEEGLLEYLEDIIGSNKYVTKIEEAAQKVEAANETRTEKLNRVKVVEKEREGLEGAKIEAEDCLQKERDIISNKSILVQMHRADAESRVKKLSAQKQEYEDNLKAEKEKARDSLEALDKYEVQLKKENKDLDVLRKNMEKAKNDFTKYERQDIKLREDIKHMKSREKKLEATIKAEEKKASECERNIEHSTQDIEKYEKELINVEKTLKKEEADLEAVYDGLKEATAGLNAKLAKKQKKLLPWSKKLNDARAKVDVGEGELKLLQDKIKEGQNQLEQAKKSLAEGEALLTSRKQEIGKAEKELTQSKTTLKERTETVKGVITKELELHKELVATKTKAEETRSSLKETTSKNAVLDNLMKMKAKGKINGIHGRLGDLGAIDATYDVAVSTACGALDHIVVESAEAGQECVQYLRDNNLGFATFILMDKMEQQYHNRMDKIPIPDKAKRLFDLVRIPDARYRTSFYHAMRDTLVCPDLDTATKIAFGSTRYRVVTYDGQLIDTSGTMSGGGTRVTRGLMGTKVVEDNSKVQQELATLERKIQGLSEKLAEVKASRTQLENEIHALTARIGELEVAIPKMEMDIKSVTQRQKEIRAGLPVLEQQQTVSASVTKRIKEVTDTIAEDQKELKKITTEHTDKLEAKIQAIQAEIMDVGGVPLQVAKGKVEATTQRIDHTKSALTKAKVQLKTGEKNLKKAKGSVEEATQELKQVQKEHEDARAELKKLEDEATVVMDAYKEQESILDKRIAELNSVNKEYEKLKKIVSQARSVELDIQHQLEDCSRSLTEWQEKAQAASKKYEDLNRKLQGLRVDEEEELEPLPIITEDELEKHSKDEVVRRIAELEEAVGKMKPNMNAIREFRKKDLEYQAKAKELEEVTQQRDAFRSEYEGLRKKRLDEFMSGFSTITMKLKEMYQMITLGGDAELELVDSLDPFSEGILFSVRPPKKSWKNISNLSGGEKTLSSLALVFALHHYKPTPLYVMDEIDAALDFKNVSIVANYIKERTRNAQFVIISLRNYMFELADRLVGIYKTEDCTKSVTINPAKFATALRATAV